MVSCLFLKVPPEQWCGVLSNNEDEAALAFETLKGDAIAVEAAMRAAASPDHPGAKAGLITAGLRKFWAVVYR